MDYKIIEEERIKRLKNWFNGKCEMPLRIHLNITNVCNLKCEFCWQSGVDKKKLIIENLTKDRIVNLVREAKKMGVLEWQLSGNGEPFCEPDITLTLMKEIKKNSMYGNIITNGTLLNSKIIEEIVKIEWNYIAFSIDGPNAKIHDKLRGVPGTFDKVMRNIKELYKIKESLNSYWPEYSLTTVINKKNYNKVTEIINLAHSLKCLGLILNLMINYGEGENLTLNEREMNIFKRNIKNNIGLVKKLNLDTNFDIFLDGGNQKENKRAIPKCYEPWYNLAIDASGSVGPCCERLNEEKDQDNIKNNSLKDIWFGKYFTNIRNNMIKDNLTNKCTNCPLWHQDLATKINMKI